MIIQHSKQISTQVPTQHSSQEFQILPPRYPIDPHVNKPCPISRGRSLGQMSLKTPSSRGYCSCTASQLSSCGSLPFCSFCPWGSNEICLGLGYNNYPLCIYIYITIVLYNTIHIRRILLEALKHLSNGSAPRDVIPRLNLLFDATLDRALYLARTQAAGQSDGCTSNAVLQITVNL